MLMTLFIILVSLLYYGMTLYTANDKHYKVIKELDIFVFRP